MAEIVRITDVSPRDGLQNEPGVIQTADKARLVELLLAAGVDEIEVSSFVSPRWVPQLADAPALFAQVAGLPRQRTLLSALVPNEKGMRAALRVNEQAGQRVLDKVAVFTAASEEFSRRNTNATIAETLERFGPVVALAEQHVLPVRAYVSCAVACPFAGPTPPERVAEVCERLVELGVHELDLADTIGVATPEQIAGLLAGVFERIGEEWRSNITIHLHDTFGRASDCVRVALQHGIRSFDGAAGGLGGCPYASTPQRRAPGNIDAGLLVRTVQAAGYRTGVDAGRLQAAGAYAAGLVRSSPA